MELRRSFLEGSGPVPPPALSESRAGETLGRWQLLPGSTVAVPGQSSSLDALALPPKETVEPHSEGGRAALLLAPNAHVPVPAGLCQTLRR